MAKKAPNYSEEMVMAITASYEAGTPVEVGHLETRAGRRIYCRRKADWFRTGQRPDKKGVVHRSTSGFARCAGRRVRNVKGGDGLLYR